MINRIQVTRVLVKDQNVAHDFYVNKLGLKVKVDMQMPEFRWLEVMPDGAETSLSIVTPFPGMPAQIGGPTGIIFDTSNVKATYDQLRANGVRFTQEPTAQPWGGIEARFADPDGNEFSLVQRTN